MSSVAHPSPARLAGLGRIAFRRASRPARTRPSLLVAVLVAAVVPLGGAQAQALGGMDAVSLRDAGRVVGGEPSISTHWKGHEWRFANEANRAAFEANPRVYAPGFGGNCPVALAEGERRPGKPDLFVVVERTLYLTSSADARQRLRDDPHAVLKRAARQWKRLPR